MAKRHPELGGQGGQGFDHHLAVGAHDDGRIRRAGRHTLVDQLERTIPSVDSERLAVLHRYCRPSRKGFDGLPASKAGTGDDLVRVISG